MATAEQRAQSIADAIFNAVATQAQVNRIGQCIAASEGREAEYTAMTSAQKGSYIVKYYRRVTIDLATKRDQAVAYNNSVAPVAASVQTEFTESL